MKGVLLGLCPAAVLVDITHAVPPGDIRAGAYLLGRAWHRFPAGTMHLAVVDPGVGTARRGLALRAHGHWFVGPDNGLFTPVLRDAEVEIVALPTPRGRRRRPSTAATCSRRPPRRSPAARRCQALGEPLRAACRRGSRCTEPHYEGKSVVGEIVYVDRFGTLVTNLTTEVVPPYAVLEVEDLEIGPLRRTFGDVPTGGLLAYVGSGGAVEIAVRDGSAARRLGLGVGGRIRARLG